MAEFIPLVYNTSLITKYERNRIVFGAPGTGKSFTLKEKLILYFLNRLILQELKI